MTSNIRVSRVVHVLLFLLVVASGIAAAVLVEQNALLFALAPTVMALAVLGLPVRVAFAAGLLAAAAVTAKAVTGALGFEALHLGEWLRVGAFVLAWATALALIAHIRRSFKLVTAMLVVAAAPAGEQPQDKYEVDLTATSGAGSRWHSYFNTTGAKIGYPDRIEADKKLLVYNSAPLTEDMEITGHPPSRYGLLPARQTASSSPIWKKSARMEASRTSLKANCMPCTANAATRRRLTANRNPCIVFDKLTLNR